MTTNISLNVGGLWRTTMMVKETITWRGLKIQIEKITCIPRFHQKLLPKDEDHKKCQFENGDEIMCEWIMYDKMHPLHWATNYENIKALQSWIISGIDINIINDDETPLMLASHCLLEKSVIELLRLGNINEYTIEIADNLHMQIPPVVGLCNVSHKKIYIKRSILEDEEYTYGTLIHEAIHASTNYLDLTLDFERHLTMMIGNWWQYV